MVVLGAQFGERSRDKEGRCVMSRQCCGPLGLTPMREPLETELNMPSTLPEGQECGYIPTSSHPSLLTSPLPPTSSSATADGIRMLEATIHSPLRPVATGGS